MGGLGLEPAGDACSRRWYDGVHHCPFLTLSGPVHAIERLGNAHLARDYRWSRERPSMVDQPEH
jgi:hypothetical protein